MHTQLGKHHAGSGLLGGGGGGGQCYPIYTRPLHDPTTHEAIMLILMREAVGDSRQQEGGAGLHTLQGHIPTFRLQGGGVTF